MGLSRWAIALAVAVPIGIPTRARSKGLQFNGKLIANGFTIRQAGETIVEAQISDAEVLASSDLRSMRRCCISRPTYSGARVRKQARRA
jgi:hypothetical protein